MRNLRILKKQIGMVSGTLLTISETMPFLSNESNGILHAFNKIIKDYKNTIFG